MEIRTTTNLTFTLNYADGEKKHVEEGILFSAENDKMDIHVGTSRKEVIFTVAECLTQFINYMDWGEDFKNYIEQGAN